VVVIGEERLDLAAAAGPAAEMLLKAANRLGPVIVAVVARRVCAADPVSGTTASCQAGWR